jgi:hypothetical protein
MKARDAVLFAVFSWLDRVNARYPIQQLASLRDAGILTEDGFAAKKADLLNRM